MWEEGVSGSFISIAGQVEKLDSQADAQKQYNLGAQETWTPACSISLSSLLWHNYNNSVRFQCSVITRKKDFYCRCDPKRPRWAERPGWALANRNQHGPDVPRGTELWKTQMLPAYMALDRCQPNGGKGKNKARRQKSYPC